MFAIFGAAFGYWYFITADSREPSYVAWNENCAGCHGKALEGTELGSALVDVQLKQGDTVGEMSTVIAKGIAGHDHGSLG